jgi:hypothetical protein
VANKLTIKSILKVVLFSIAIIFAAELFGILPFPKFVQKYLDEMDVRTNAKIAAWQKFGGTSNRFPNDYSSLFDKNEKLHFNKTLTFEYRRPLSIISYENKFVINIFKLDTLSNIAVNKTIIENYSDAGMINNVIYSTDEKNLVNFYYNNSTLPKPSIIYFSLSGIQNRVIIKNDSVAYYYSRFNNFSIRSNINGPQNMVAISKQDNVPIEILFIKKHNELYLLTMIPNENNLEFDPNKLYNLIKH